MLLHRVQINKRQLESIPQKERIFFLKSANFFNEINILQKMASFSNKNVENGPPRKAQNSQSFFIVMELSSKLFEASEMIKNDFYGSGISREYDSLLSRDAKECLKNIKRYFNNDDNIIKKVRNKFVSHLDSHEIANSFNGTPEDEIFELYFSETYANSFFYLTNIMIGYNILNTLHSDPMKALDMFFDEVLKTTGWFKDFIGDSIQVVAKKYFSESFKGIKTIKIADAPSIDDIVLPYFIEKKK